VSEVRVLQLARRTVCYVGATLEVTSEPGGLDVWLGERRVGTTPWSAVIARGMVTVAVAGDGWRDSIATRVPVDRLVRVHFRAPADTVPWPVEPPRERLVAALEQSVQWTPSAPEPAAPDSFTAKRPKGGRIVGAVVGAVAGGFLGYAIDPHSDSVAADVALGGVAFGAVGWWVGKKLDDAAYDRRVRAYQRRDSAYAGAYAAWREQMDAERAALVDRLADGAAAAQHVRADSLRSVIRAENERIRARNRAAPRPTVTVERQPVEREP